MNSFLKSILFVTSLSLISACAKLEASEGKVSEELRLTLTIEEDYDTKTCRGSKDGNIYHTLWQSGDRISLNGVSSAALESEQAGQRKASFVFRGGLAAPFNILYPATDSPDMVNFPAEQNYHEDSFDPAAAPMWASSSVYADMSLRHLSSLVRLSLKDAEGAVLSGVTLCAMGGEQISGEFRLGTDAEGRFTGEIEPAGGSTNVTMTFGDGGLQLSSEPTFIYIAIPAGDYSNGFKATLWSTDGKAMMLSFFGGGKRTIAPAKVLEFPNVEFVPDGADVLHVRNAADFARLSSTEAKTVYIHNDIDMTGVSWKGCGSGFDGVIDGMGHVVKGITTKTFIQKAVSDCDLTIKNLTFTGCTNTILTFGGGKLTLENCRFIGNTAANVPVLSVPSSATSGGITIARCDFIGNATKSTSSNQAAVTIQGQIPVYLSSCRFIDNLGSNFGSAIHFAKAANSTLALNNCLFWGNRNSASSDPVPLNVSSENFIMINSTVIQSIAGYRHTIRCGASGGMDKAFMANNIVHNINASGDCFYTAATTYFLRSEGYNQYGKTCLELSSGVSLGETYSWTKTGGAPGTNDNAVGVPEDFTAPTEENGYLWSWEMPADKEQYLPTTAQIESLLTSDPVLGGSDGVGTAFVNWLKSVSVKDHNALETDCYGNLRNASGLWPGCYQKQEAGI